MKLKFPEHTFQLMIVVSLACDRLYAEPLCRHFYERNQTVRLGRPSHDDSGQYKCVGYGRSASDEINYEIEFVVRGQYCILTSNHAHE